ncbi:helix-turn-helix transcriptional regulator [Sphingomonas adhaesiva]|nr:helix-turn-helix transcriptional regulator [Sphingomonas adhaesiva]
MHYVSMQTFRSEIFLQFSPHLALPPTNYVAVMTGQIYADITQLGEKTIMSLPLVQTDRGAEPSHVTARSCRDRANARAIREDRRMPDDDLVGRIYEAALMPERWPMLLEALALHVGARGGTLGRHSDGDPHLITSPGIASMVEAFVAGGYHADNVRSAPLLRIDRPGFVSEYEVHDEEARLTLPVYRDFLTPNNFDKAAGTVILGASSDRLVLTVEGFWDREGLERAVPQLDVLRPHLARAAILAAELQLRECRSIVEAFGRIGAGAAILGRRGEVIAHNDRFGTQLAEGLLEQRERLRFSHRASDAAFLTALGGVQTSGRGASVAIRDDLGIGVAALHLVPVRRSAQEVFAGATTIAVVARPAVDAAPDARLIQALFDLTPTEATVARAIASGSTLEDIARTSGKSIETVRSHLKRVYSKTATGRQNELAVLLRGFGSPADD